MKNLALVVLASGDSTRFNLPVSKLFIRLNTTPLWAYLAKNLESFYDFDEKVVVCKNPDFFMKFATSFEYVRGGDTRAESLLNALKGIKSEFVLICDGARPLISKECVLALIAKQETSKADCISPILRVSDSLIYEDEFLNREKLGLIYTPQLSRTKLLKKALEKSLDFTDDSAAVASVGGRLDFIKADENARKITFESDLLKLPLPPLKQEFFTGCGFDVHAFGAKRPLILGGVVVDAKKGLVAHSDGDVLVHALIDALFGAAGLGDIGDHFPDSDSEYKNVSSMKLLKICYEKVLKYGFVLVNADICVLMQSPKLGGYKKEIALHLSKALNNTNINIKASTTEKLGFVGRDEGVAVMANVSLKYFEWMKNEDFNNRK